MSTSGEEKKGTSKAEELENIRKKRDDKLSKAQELYKERGDAYASKYEKSLGKIDEWYMDQLRNWAKQASSPQEIDEVSKIIGPKAMKSIAREQIKDFAEQGNTIDQIGQARWDKLVGIAVSTSTGKDRTFGGLLGDYREVTANIAAVNKATKEDILNLKASFPEPEKPKSNKR